MGFTNLICTYFSKSRFIELPLQNISGTLKFFFLKTNTNIDAGITESINRMKNILLTRDKSNSYNFITVAGEQRPT